MAENYGKTVNLVLLRLMGPLSLAPIFREPAVVEASAG